MPGITMRGPGRLAASPALGGVPRGGEPGSGEGRGPVGGRAGLPYVSTADSKRASGCPRDSEKGKGPPWQSEQMAGRLCKSGNHSKYNHQHASQSPEPLLSTPCVPGAVSTLCIPIRFQV